VRPKSARVTSSVKALKKLSRSLRLLTVAGQILCLFAHGPGVPEAPPSVLRWHREDTDFELSWGEKTESELTQRQGDDRSALLAE